MTYRNKKNMQKASMLAGALACLAYLAYYLLQTAIPINMSAALLLVIFGVLHFISKFCEHLADTSHRDASDEDATPEGDDNFE
jgi:hypothetical protein